MKEQQQDGNSHDWVTHLVHTSQIDPKAYAFRTSHNRLWSLRYAIAGCLYMLRRQRNTWIMTIATCVVIGVGLWVHIDPVSWAMLWIEISLVWVMEFMNAIIEALVDLYTADYHPLAKIAKDVASAAVLLMVINSVMVGLFILGPPLLQSLEFMTQR